jgi:hypothetical protein
LGLEASASFDARDGRLLGFWTTQAEQGLLLLQRRSAGRSIWLQACDGLRACCDVGLEDFLDSVELATLFFDASLAGCDLCAGSLSGCVGLHHAADELAAAND